MEIYRSLQEYSDSTAKNGYRNLAVTLGKFDGIHLGHRKLINRVVRAASSEHICSAVFAIGVNGSGILTMEEREELLGRMGVDILIECPFSKNFMMMSPDVFVRTVLRDTLHASYAAVGADYRFGHDRAGDAETLKALGDSYGYRTDIIDKEMYLGEEISSTRIRLYLANGDMEPVTHMLGRPYFIEGTVSHGRHIGTGLGMPTVNLRPQEGKLLPPDGVYVTRTYILNEGAKQRCVGGVTNVGFRPTVNGRHRTIETTLLDFDGDLYGRKIRTDILKYIRGEIKFDSLMELKEQVEKDTVRARVVLGSSEAGERP